jgi:predicted amidohydrolase YtcJ
VLDRDIEATAPEEIGRIAPVLTVCDGKVTFER